MIQGSVELCSIYADFNFGVTSIVTQRKHPHSTV